MIKSLSAPSLGYSQALRQLSTIRIPSLPRLGLARLVIDAIDAGARAHDAAHLTALGLNRPARKASKEQNDY